MNLNNDLTCMQAIGYKELFPYFKGEDSLENCIDKLKQDTRNSKRQLTWFKNKLETNYIDSNKNVNEMIEYIQESLKG